MAYKVKLNGKSYEFYTGRWYNANGDRISDSAILNHLNYAYENDLKEYNPQSSKKKAAPKSSKTRYRINIDKAKWSKALGTNDFFQKKNGRLQDWAKPLATKRESWQKGVYQPGEAAWQKRQFRDLSTGALKRDIPGRTWGAQTFNAKAKQLANSATFTHKDWVRHLEIAMHMLYTNAERFRVAMGHYAISVFKKSFELQKFNSDGSHAWRPLSEYTKNKRGKRGTLRGSRPILREYLDLYDSLKMDKESSTKVKKKVANATTIFTDIVKADPRKHKKKSICYAGYHNEGVGTYGRAGRGGRRTPYIQRQFIGHSSHFHPFKDYTTKTLTRLYFFDNIFLVQKFYK